MLAERLDEWLEGYDPYSYRDDDMDIEKTEQWLSADPEGVIKYLLEAEYADSREESEALLLVAEITDLMTKAA